MSKYGPPHEYGLPHEEPAFSTNEYNARLRNVRRVMEERDIDVLLIHDLSNIYYISGFDQAKSGYGYNCVVLPREKDEELTVLTNLVDSGIALDMTWVKDVRWWDDYSLDEENTVKVLKEKGLADKTIGMEFDSAKLLCSYYFRFKELLPDAKLVKASDIILGLREIKSPKEIEYLWKSHEIATKAVEAGIEAVREGVTERDVAFAISRSIYENGGDYRSLFCCYAGKHGASLHGFPTDKKIQRGEAVAMEPFPRYRGYSLQILRTCTVGSAPPKVRRMHECCVEAVEKATEAIRPGVPIADVDRVTRDIAAKYGYEKYRQHMSTLSQGISHGMVRISKRMTGGWLKGETREYQPGMTLSLEPNLSSREDGIGILLGNGILVTKTGHEVLNKLPLDLVEK